MALRTAVMPSFLVVPIAVIMRPLAVLAISSDPRSPNHAWSLISISPFHSAKSGCKVSEDQGSFLARGICSHAGLETVKAVLEDEEALEKTGGAANVLVPNCLSMRCSTCDVPLCQQATELPQNHWTQTLTVLPLTLPYEHLCQYWLFSILHLQLFNELYKGHSGQSLPSQTLLFREPRTNKHLKSRSCHRLCHHRRCFWSQFLQRCKS